LTVTNDTVISTSKVYAWVSNYSGTVVTNGVPIIFSVVPAFETITITVLNMHATNALNGKLTINFMVF
jgi:hypothetical protein